MNRITFTSPSLEDIPTLWQWGEENWELWGDELGKWFSKKSLLKMLENPEDDIFLVARKNGQPIGMCMTTTIRDWAYCFALFVEENYRGQGIGKKLIDETHRQLKENGVESLILLVDVKNERAERFYLREGYRKGYGFHMMIKRLKS